jgi:hypothetical protein
MPFWRKDRWTDSWLLLCTDCSYLRVSYTIILVKTYLFYSCLLDVGYQASKF